MDTPKLYLTADTNRKTSLWEDKPHYFQNESDKPVGIWQRPGPPIIDSTTTLGYPPLKKIAADLGIEPGPEGILIVTMDIRPAE